MTNVRTNKTRDGTCEFPKDPQLILRNGATTVVAVVAMAVVEETRETRTAAEVMKSVTVATAAETMKQSTVVTKAIVGQLSDSGLCCSRQRSE